jgi:glycosidase
MSNKCTFWVVAFLFVFDVACDDEQSKTERVPQIPLGGITAEGGIEVEENPPQVCERIFMYVDRGSEPQDVKVAGTFEVPPWSGSITLTDENGDGTWLVSTPVSEGRHQYKFIIDGDWRNDLDQSEVVDDGAGGFNNVFVHACPFEPACISDEQCTDEETPLCRGYQCVADAQPTICERCPEDCNEQTGNCVEAPSPECDASNACSPPLRCEEGRCVPECQEDADCIDIDDTALCIDLECIVPECEDDDSCDPLAESCLAYQCVPRPCSEYLFIYDAGNQTYDSIHVAGDFNADDSGQWPTTVEAGGWPMTQLPDGRYYTRQIVENGSYAYKFVLTQNGITEWISDPMAYAFIDDGFDGQNSLLEQNCADAPAQPGQCGDLTSFQWEDAVMYFVMVDRFNNSDQQVDRVPNVTGGDATSGPSGQYEGGDLNGVTSKLPYLSELGVNALWLSAPYENRNLFGAAINPSNDPNTYSGYHGYWPSPQDINYADPSNPTPRPQVETRIGDEDALRTLVNDAHRQDVKVLFDYVMNHVDGESELAQAHPSWFARKENGQIALCGPENLWDDAYWGTRCAFTDYLPPFDFDRQEARLWSVNDAMWWAQEFGIDGYRLDAIKHVPLSWLEDLRSAINEQITEPEGGRFYLVGETFAYDDPELIRSFVDPQTMLDGQFDFPFKARLCEALFRPDGRLDSFSSWMNSNDSFYGANALMTTWIGNHDIPRAIHFASGEIANCREGSSPQNGWYMSYPQPIDGAAYQRLGLAFGIMMTNPGIPLIYYGDEVGLAGGGDPDNRRLMPWDDSSLNPHQLELRQMITQLTNIRAAYKNLSRGRRITLSADQDTWVYRMLGCSGDSVAVTIALNRADTERTVNLPAGGYTDLLSGESIMGGSLMLSARAMRVLITEE